MSKKVFIHTINNEEIDKINKDLILKVEDNKISKEVITYDIDNNTIYLPFAYAKKYKKNSKETYGKIDVKFEGVLREMQKEIKNEAIQHLNKDGCTIISAYPGSGKCLKYNTPIIMFNGDIKMIQHIEKNDKLMGDDSTPRNVKSITRGKEKMYEIIQEYGDNYTVNESHILSLIQSTTKEILNISVMNYLKLENKNNYMGYKVGINFKFQDVNIHPYKMGQLIGENKYEKIPTEYKYNNTQCRLELLAGILDTIGTTYTNHYGINFNQNSMEIEYIIRSVGYRCTKTTTMLHIYGKVEEIPVKKIKKIKKTVIKDWLFSKITIKDSNETDYYGFEIDGNKLFLLGDFTVTHNTSMAINISTLIKLKTLIITHRIVLIHQWKEAIHKFCPTARVEIITTKDEKKDSDYYIMNASNVCKKERDFYNDIGFLCIDECHLIMAESMSKCMQMITPRYILGLSATPYREDGLNQLFDLYFGTNRIERKLYKEHIVYKLKTEYTPTIEYCSNGRLNWSVLLDSQSLNTDRNEMIITILKFFKDRVFLVLCKRVEQGKYLIHRLKEENEDVTSLIGKQQVYEQTSRILVGTTGKCSVGFDHPRLDSLLLASDIQSYFIQVLGRIFRNNQSIITPMVIDIVDNHGILEQHYKTRKDVYTQHGGIIKNFKKDLPEIFKLNFKE